MTYPRHVLFLVLALSVLGVSYMLARRGRAAEIQREGGRGQPAELTAIIPLTRAGSRPAPEHLLTLAASPWFLAVAAFVGTNMPQSAFTKFCPPDRHPSSGERRAESTRPLKTRNAWTAGGGAS